MVSPFINPSLFLKKKPNREKWKVRSEETVTGNRWGNTGRNHLWNKLYDEEGRRKR